MLELLVVGVLVLLLASVLADRKPWTPVKGYDYLGKGPRGWLHVIGYDDRGHVVLEDSDGVRLEASKRRFARIVHQDMSRKHRIHWTADRAADGYGKSAKTVGRWKFTLQEAVSEVEKLEKENERLRNEHVEKQLTIDASIEPIDRDVYVFGADKCMKELQRDDLANGTMQTVICPKAVKIIYEQNKVLIYLHE